MTHESNARWNLLKHFTKGHAFGLFQSCNDFSFNMRLFSKVILCFLSHAAINFQSLFSETLQRLYLQIVWCAFALKPVLLHATDHSQLAQILTMLSRRRSSSSTDSTRSLADRRRSRRRSSALRVAGLAANEAADKQTRRPSVRYWKFYNIICLE